MGIWQPVELYTQVVSLQLQPQAGTHGTYMKEGGWCLVRGISTAPAHANICSRKNGTQRVVDRLEGPWAGLQSRAHRQAESFKGGQTHHQPPPVGWPAVVASGSGTEGCQQEWWG